ncbi:MAG: HEAT repeat domain-containing protein [Planctomycetes bacterium]|nr:HEAT repeat domain-containing protein [Planctomycetota bacterium]
MSTDKETEKTKETRSTRGKKKVICVTAGKLAGDIARRVYPIGREVSKLGSTAYQGAQQVVKKGEQAVKDTFACCGTHGRKKELKQTARKQHQIFTQLGAEIFHLMQKNIQDVLGQPQVEKYIKELGEIERQFKEAKRAMEDEHLEKERVAIFNRAVKDLKNTDTRIRLTAIRVLEKLGKKESIAYLSKALSDPDKNVRARASAVINKLSRTNGDGPQKTKKKAKKPKTVTPPAASEEKSEPSIGSDPEPEPA